MIYFHELNQRVQQRARKNLAVLKPGEILMVRAYRDTHQIKIAFDVEQRLRLWDKGWQALQLPDEVQQ